MRLFLAIELPKEIKENVHAYAKSLNIGKIIPPENLHITLSFLGDVEKNEIIEKLNNIEFKKCRISLKGCGVFPSISFVRVLWIKANGCDNIKNALKKEGFEVNDILHLTISRVKHKPSPSSINHFLEKCNKKEFGSFEVSYITLFNSILKPPHPTYEVVKRFPAKDI